MEAKEANTEDSKGVTIRDLIRTALRMRPDRVIIGEVRGAEAVDLLQAFNTGHEGSLCTAHANSCRDMLSRLETMVLMGIDLPLEAIRHQIASGVDMTIFGGHMVTGCMPVIAKKGTEWNGVESLIGKKFACNPSYFAFTGAVMELGYDKPLEALDWQVFTSYDDALAAVVRGEVDYALMGTGQNYAVKNRDDVEIVTYQSEVMPNYSCCRMEALTEFVENNPVTLKCIMKALLRAQAYYEANRDECVTLLANTIGATEEYVAAYMLDDAHYVVNVDPLHNSVVRAWGILDATGFLDENAKNINIEDHINTTLYQEALAEATAEFGSEAPDFYAKQLTFFNENNL